MGLACLPERAGARIIGMAMVSCLLAAAIGGGGAASPSWIESLVADSSALRVTETTKRWTKRVYNELAGETRETEFKYKSIQLQGSNTPMAALVNRNVQARLQQTLRAWNAKGHMGGFFTPTVYFASASLASVEVKVHDRNESGSLSYTELTALNYVEDRGAVKPLTLSMFINMGLEEELWRLVQSEYDQRFASNKFSVKEPGSRRWFIAADGILWKFDQDGRGRHQEFKMNWDSLRRFLRPSRG